MNKRKARARRFWALAKPRLAAALFGLAACAGIVAAFHVQMRRRAPSATALPPGALSGRSFIERDEQLGLRTIPGLHEPQRLTWNGRTLFDVTYDTDEFGRRITPQPPGPYERFAIFAGCSFVFGYGVQGGETLPARFAEDAVGRKLHVYNESTVGWGPNHLLALLSDPAYPRGIAEKRGIWLYLFIEHHLQRAGGSVRDDSRLFTHPYYRVAADGRLERLAAAGVAHPPGEFGRFGYFMRNQFERYDLQMPQALLDQDIELTAKILKESQRLFRQKFASDGFYVILYPGNRSGPRLAARLADADIRVLDYQKLFTSFDDKGDLCIFRGVENHPNPVAYKILADALYDDLEVAGAL
jgi:hypothetical protein